MKPREKIVAGLRELALRQDVRTASLAEISRASGVSRPTVRRHVGGLAGLVAFVEREGIAVPADVPPQDKGQDDVKMSILEAAFRVFAEKGYPGTSIDAVAQDAGLTKGAVYWHFASKRDLFRELMLLRNAEGIALGPIRLEEAETRTGGPGMSDNPHEILTALLDQQIRQIEQESDWWWLTFENLTEARDADMRKDLSAGLTSLVKANEALVDSEKSAGRLSMEVDNEGLAVLFQAMLIGFGYINLIDPKLLQNRDLGSKIAHTLWHGLDHSGP